ncbi:sigma factor-like helix-turn-helix DNA-binding protein [Streptomyces sp. NBC_00687]|uniref:sigma factor-like helix-turn-helix DNA-binding protein n=1 Tax=Streptomyces sp. NBC_00687 TaxID=2975807 RepID=UPI00225811D9|nr:sigma factor-like helix-turn-helix DNA-binding protein [Streptomyces sp. NBC_00687]MCX4917023.1 RNA polymerase subunit sigma-70 [Streptomyces sp. NBC_00687]
MTMDGDWLQAAFGALPARSQRMIEDRALGKTLGSIGQEHDVTRERVRQLLLKAQKQLFASADVFVDDWRDRLTTLTERSAVPQSEVAAVLGVRDQMGVGLLVEAVGAEHPLTWAGRLRGWWTRSPGALEVLLRRGVEEAPLRGEDVAVTFAAAGVPDEVPLLDLLGHPDSPLVPGFEGTWLRRRARGRDAAYLFLLANGEPCRAEELLAPTGIRRKPAVAEALRRDERFVQLRLEGKWALAEWPHLNVTPYPNAMEAFVAVLTELGPLPRDALFVKVCERYPVTLWRLHQCLLDDRVGITEDGLIELVARGATPIEESEPAQPARMAVDPAGNVFGVRLTVDKDVLRGSGIVVSSWLTWHLGMRQAPMARTFSIAGHPTPIVLKRATSAAQISSLRVLAKENGMVGGCEFVLFLRTDDSTARIEHACARHTCPAMSEPSRIEGGA